MTTEPRADVVLTSEVAGRQKGDVAPSPAEDVSVREFLTVGARRGLTTDQMLPG